MDAVALLECRTQSAPSLVYMPHPMTADGRQQFGAVFIEGETLGEYLERHGAKPAHSAVAVTVNGIPIPAANWENLLPRVGDQIVLRSALQGGSGGGSKAIRSVSLIAIAVLSAYTGGAASAAGWSATESAAASAAVSIGGSMLINALLPPLPATAQSSAVVAAQLAAASFSLSGGSNQARLYGSLPICVGYNKISPDLASNAYTEFSGADQYLYQAFNFGLSDFQYLADFAIGDTPISSYDGVSIEVSGPDGKLASIAGNVDSMSVQDLLNVDGWVQRTTSIDTTLIALDFASVLYYVNADGSFAPVAVNFTCQYCPTGTNAWVAFAGGAQSIVGSSQTAVRTTLLQSVPQGQYDVRVLKTDLDIALTNESNDLNWTQMRSYQVDTADYTGQLRVGLTIKASDQLNGTISNFTAMGQAGCQVWNGSAWVFAATSNPAWWGLWWARGKFINGRRVYGAGLPDSRIDIAGLIEFAAYCDANSLTCDFVQTEAASIATIMDQIVLNGDGSSTWLTGKLGVVWDAPNQSPVQQFGPWNIVRDSFSVAYNTEQIADEIIVNFTNPAKNWAQDSVRATVPNVEAPNNPVTLDFIGCIDVNLAGRKANLLAAQQYYRRRTITWTSDFEGFVAQRGDVVSLSHDMTVWSYGGRLVGGDRLTLQLGRPVPLALTPGWVGVRFPDGTYQVFATQGGTGTVSTLTLVDPIPAEYPVPDESADTVPYDWAFTFDPLETPGKLVKITSVIPQSGGNQVQIIATDEEPLYYASTTSDYDYTPPPQHSHLSGDAIALGFTEQLQDATTGRSRVTLSWQTGQPTSANVSVTINGGAAVKYSTSGNSIDFDAYTNDVITATVTPVSIVQLVSTMGASGRYIVQGVLSALPTPANLCTVYRDSLTHIVWSAVVDARAPDYEVRSGLTWQTGSVVADTPLPDIIAGGDGSYFVASRYVAPSGTTIFSAPAHIVVAGSTLVRNVVAISEEAPTWPGVFSGGAALDSGVLLLRGAGNVLAEPNFLSVLDVLEYGGVTATGTYTLSTSHQINAGRVAPCQLIITSSVRAVRDNDNVLAMLDFLSTEDTLDEALGTFVAAQPQIAIAQANGVFGAWQDFVPGVYSGQFFTARLLLSTSDPAIQPQVSEFSLTVDMPDRLDTGTNVTAPSSGLTVTFSTPFNGGPDASPVPHVQITLINAQVGDTAVLSPPTVAGFSVKVLNAAGVAVTRSINWRAQGY
jgi:sulfur carrier protein ThiS